MINIRDLKENKEKYIKGFINKGSDLTSEVEKIIELHDKYLTLLNEEQDVRMNLNQTTNLIKSNPQDNEIKSKAKELSERAKELKEETSKLDLEINELNSYFPNLADDSVPVGKDEDENVVLSTHMDDKKENKFSKPHWEIIEEKNMILNDEAGFISGARQVIYNDKTALVVKALERFMIENALESNYTLIEPPVIVNRQALFNTGQLPKFEEDLYKVGDDQFLIPTAEVPLTNLVANKLMDESELPKQFVGATSCFRKESGSAGRDTRGIIRLHQFRKVELVAIGKPQDEEKDFNLMLSTATRVLDKLELPYRLLQLCTGDASFTSRKTVDIEVWMPGVDTYREISSVSSAGDFQARRMKARYKDSEGNKELVYTYNGSGLAIGRTLAAIIENYIQENGMIKVPTALQKYLPFEEF